MGPMSRQSELLRVGREMTKAIGQKSPCRLFAELGLHITELVDSLQNPDKSSARQIIKSTFVPSDRFPQEADK